MSRKRTLSDDEDVVVSGKKQRSMDDDNLKQLVLMAVQAMEERQAEKERSKSIFGVFSTVGNVFYEIGLSLSVVDPSPALQSRIISFFGDVMRVEYEREVVPIVSSYPDDVERYCVSVPYIHRVSCYKTLAFFATEGIFGGRVTTDASTNCILIEFYYSQNPQALSAYGRQESSLPINTNTVTVSKPGDTQAQKAANFVIDRVNRCIRIIGSGGEVLQRGPDNRVCVVSVVVEHPVRAESLEFALTGKVVTDALFYTWDDGSGKLCMVLETTLP